MDPISSARAYGGPSSIGRLNSAKSVEGTDQVGATENVTPTNTFTDVLAGALNEANTMQKKADHTIEQMATGEVQDIHQVMVAFEQAKLSMQTLVETRNKLVEAYQEISRMPI